MDIEIDADVRAARRQLNDWERRIIPGAIGGALTKTGRAVRTRAKRRLAKQLGFSQKEINKDITVFPSKPTVAGRLGFVNIRVRNRPYNTIRWVVPSRRHPGAFKNFPALQAFYKGGPWGRRQTYKNAFIIYGKFHNKPIVVTRGPGGRSLKGHYGPTLGALYRDWKKRPSVQRFIRLRFRKFFESELTFRLNRLINR